MQIKNHLFEVFDRENFIYRKNMMNADKVKKDYTTAWNQWKVIVNNALMSSDSRGLALENTENWQNSGNLSKRFWTRIKYKEQFKKPSCIAAMISKNNLKVYLEWHEYKNELLHAERKLHNSWIDFVDEWIEGNDIDPTKYRIWTNREEDESFEMYMTLHDFLTNGFEREHLLNELKENRNNWIRVGRIYAKTEALSNVNISSEMGRAINELEWLYRKAIGISLTTEEYTNKPTVVSVKEKEASYLSSIQLTTHIHAYISSKGFYYTKEDVTNLFLSLKSKPFLILSGISGTGKTKIVQWFSESVGANEDNGQFTLIPIRPDWNDGSDLLGYRDIKGDFKEGPLTKVIKNAIANPSSPYFVLLDEMNLARVEYYFSDILSVMESRMWDNGQMVSSLLLTKEETGTDLRIPSNLYIIGTVNMDETTHPFSKKVLDRANTIEFNNVDLQNLSFLGELTSVQPITVKNHQLESKFLHLKDVYNLHKDIVVDATNELVRINKALESNHAHVGYRVRDEICFYLAYNHTGELFSFEQAFDYCILQKILPRISGSDTRVEKVLKELYTIFTNINYEPNQLDYTSDLQNAKYPLSARKVLEMLRRLEEDGFTSFWVS